MNTGALMRYVSQSLNHTGPGANAIDPDEWDRVIVDNREGLGCFQSALETKTTAIGVIGGNEYDQLECWLVVPVDNCGRCALRVYCGSRVEFPDERPGEVFEVTGRAKTTRARCQQWALKLECGPCDD